MNKQINTLDKYLSPNQGERKKQIKRSRSSPELSPPDKRPQVKAKIENMSQEVGKLSLEELLVNFRGLLADMQVATKPDLLILANELDALKKENKTLKEKVTNLQTLSEEQGRRIDSLENTSKKRNLVFKGMPISNEGDNKAIEELCAGVLQVENVKVQNVRKLNSKGKDGTILVASFSSDKEVNDILRSTKKLRGTRISIDRDLALGTRQVRNKLLQIRREILKNKAGVNVVVRNDVMYCEQRRFFWRKDTGLITSEGVSGLDFLNKLLGVDMSAFLFSLQNNGAPQRGAERHVHLVK